MFETIAIVKRLAGLDVHKMVIVAILLLTVVDVRYVKNVSGRKTLGKMVKHHTPDQKKMRGQM